MIKITLPDGSIKEIENGTLAISLAKELSPSLAKKAIVAKIDGVLVDLRHQLKRIQRLSLLHLRIIRKRYLRY